MDKDMRKKSGRKRGGSIQAPSQDRAGRRVKELKWRYDTVCGRFRWTRANEFSGCSAQAVRSNSVRETRRIADTKTNDPFREIGVGILTRPDSRETASR
jgi:hypothetical protein